MIENNRKIHLLNETLVNQIAAGEVVERPASVVKELVENSIDAGANSITIDIVEGGKKRIRVIDNGCGIHQDDLLFALERHATSKIISPEDLFKIQTMGFRGEALASIGSVSHLILSSRTPESTQGYNIINHGGIYEDITMIGMPVGTEISVEDLFFNTPARLKFLKSDNTEFQHIVSFVTAIALQYFEISFELYHDGKKLISFPAVEEHFQRMVQVFGANLSKELIAIHYHGEHIEISGWVGNPSIARSSRASQYLYVNRRTVDSIAVSKAVESAFQSLIPIGKYPLMMLQINLDFSFVDVNVHPRKKEVRFVNGGEIFQLVSLAAKKALESRPIVPEIQGQQRSYWSTENLYKNTNSENVQQAIEFTKAFLDKNENKLSVEQIIEDRQHREISDITENPIPSIYPIGQIANSYILAYDENGLHIIDQHAAHERVMYEYFIKRANSKIEEQNVHVQKLLAPLMLELTPVEAEIFSTQCPLFTSLGFEFESFGGHTFLITSIPLHLKDKDLVKILKEVIDDLKEGTQKNISEPEHEAICYMACRSAIKFGQALTMNEMSSLLLQLKSAEKPHTCPHGRPTRLTLTFEELQKRFGRK